MSVTVSADVSEYQPPADDTYTRDWLIFRICDGTYVDKNAAANLAWAVRARAGGKIQGFTAYVVYRPGETRPTLQILDRLGVPTDCVLMVDAESWSGAIKGDRSAEINAFATQLRVRQGGRADLVWGYGNRGPDLEIWPTKPAWLGWVVASYGGSRPNVPNLAGWQYTDGQPTWDAAGRPHTSAPFGRCDHNLLYQLPEQTKEMDVLADLTPAQLDQIAAAVWSYGVPKADGTNTWQAQSLLRDTRREAANAYHTALTAADPVKIAAAVVAALPKTAGQLTEADVESAVRSVFADAADGAS